MSLKTLINSRFLFSTNKKTEQVSVCLSAFAEDGNHTHSKLTSQYCDCHIPESRLCYIYERIQSSDGRFTLYSAYPYSTHLCLLDILWRPLWLTGQVFEQSWHPELNNNEKDVINYYDRCNRFIKHPLFMNIIQTVRPLNTRYCCF